jgi:hypothetical protein
MALTLDATIGGATANSYATRAQGDAYHDKHLWSDAWKSAEAWKKDAALIMATRLLDEQVEWYGTPTDNESQVLRWPRIGVLTKDGDRYWDQDELPRWLIDATAEMARYLISEDRTAERGYGIKKVKADVVEVEFDTTDQKPVLPASVRSMVSPYGALSGPTSGFRKLMRT